jgi:hypothetical protein
MKKREEEEKKNASFSALFWLCGLVSLLSLIPFMGGLVVSTRMNALIWKDSAKYVGPTTYRNQLYEHNPRDWQCVLPPDQPKNFTALKNAFFGSSSSVVDNTTTKLELLESTTSFYGSTTFLIFFPTWILTWAWFCSVVMPIAAYCKRQPRREEDEDDQKQKREENQNEEGQSQSQSCTEGEVNNENKNKNKNKNFDFCLSCFGFYAALVCLAVVHFGVYFLQETFTRLTDFNHFGPLAMDHPCIIENRKDWIWSSAPFFTEETNKACLETNCLLPPYVNATWWWVGMVAVALPLLSFFGSATWFCCHPESRESEKDDARECALASLLAIPLSFPLVLFILGSVLTWNTFGTLQPTVDFIFMPFSPSPSSVLFAVQRITTIATVACLVFGFSLQPPLRALLQRQRQKTRNEGQNPVSLLLPAETGTS